MATPVSRAVKLSMALFLSLSPSEPFTAKASGRNETRWRESINSDIRNGAPEDYICRNSKSSAGASDDANFKDWAWSIARKYCPPDEMGKPSNKGIEPQQPQPEQSNCRMMSSVDAEKAMRGQYVDISSGRCVMIFNPQR